MTRKAFFLACLLAAVLVFSGCAKRLDLTPEAPKTLFFEQTRQVTFGLLGMNFISTETIKYRQDILEIQADAIEMTFVPLEYAITTSTGKGASQIFGTKYLRQPNESPDVSLLREMAGGEVFVRVRKDGTIENMRTKTGARGQATSAEDFARVQDVHETLKRIFIGTHVLVTQSVLPTGPVRTGEAYRPAGLFLELDDKGDKKLMMVESLDAKGEAVLRVDAGVIEELFKEASAAVPLPPSLEDQITLAGDGSGEFRFDTKRRCMTSGTVRLTARAEQAEGKGAGIGLMPFSVNVKISVREIPREEAI